MTDVSWALRHFAHGNGSPPFEYHGVTVFGVQPKVGFAVPRTGRVHHRVTQAAGTYDRGRLRLAAVFVCGADSVDALLRDETQIDGDRCEKCDQNLTPCVYRCYNPAGHLLYVGSTSRRYDRMQQHRLKTPWWRDVGRVDYEDFESLFAARSAERIAIADEDPVHNRYYKRKGAVVP